MKNNRYCRRWTNQYSESLLLTDKEELVRHREICSTCRGAYEEDQLIHKTLQVTPNVKPLPDITFRQLLALEQVHPGKRHNLIRKRDLVFAALYGSGVPSLFYGIFILIWLQFSNPFRAILSSSPALMGIFIQTLVIYVVNVIICRFTQEILNAACRKRYRKLTRQIGGIVVMCSSLVTSVIFAYTTGIDLWRLLPFLIIGIIPYNAERKMQGELRVEAIFWGITLRDVPHSLPQLDMPIVRQIGDIAESMKRLQWI